MSAPGWKLVHLQTEDVLPLQGALSWKLEVNSVANSPPGRHASLKDTWNYQRTSFYYTRTYVVKYLNLETSD